MKQMIAIVLFSSLMILSFNGCCPKCPEPNIIYVPQKCIIPTVDLPIVDNSDTNTSKGAVSKALLNYIEMKKYAEKLLKSQEVCH